MLTSYSTDNMQYIYDFVTFLVGDVWTQKQDSAREQIRYKFKIKAASSVGRDLALWSVGIRSFCFFKMRDVSYKCGVLLF